MFVCQYGRGVAATERCTEWIANGDDLNDGERMQNISYLTRLKLCNTVPPFFEKKRQLGKLQFPLSNQVGPRSNYEIDPFYTLRRSVHIAGADSHLQKTYAVVTETRSKLVENKLQATVFWTNAVTHGDWRRCRYGARCVGRTIGYTEEVAFYRWFGAMLGLVNWLT